MAAQQAAAITDSKQLETLQLSQLSVDDSGPPQVNYGTDNPLASSTPRTSVASQISAANMKHDRQIISGISKNYTPHLPLKMIYTSAHLENTRPWPTQSLCLYQN